MSFSTIYNIFFKRNAVFVGTVFASAFVFQAAFDTAVTSWYEAHNKGKLWKDVKLTLGESGDDGDDEDDE
ncbi:LAMI_0H08482g1_1 [Lachancea mirantina]|uniref:Complex III subunit 9 n=1 Tax=Lachancea mirantina TaxID=1230905 RepID=A0A1G4KG35_9SACH|nr:LAMI_0H08482g1_1 [Lachancea mirantina]